MPSATQGFKSRNITANARVLSPGRYYWVGKALKEDLASSQVPLPIFTSTRAPKAEWLSYGVKSRTLENCEKIMHTNTIRLFYSEVSSSCPFWTVWYQTGTQEEFLNQNKQQN